MGRRLPVLVSRTAIVLDGPGEPGRGRRAAPTVTAVATTGFEDLRTDVRSRSLAPRETPGAVALPTQPVPDSWAVAADPGGGGVCAFTPAAGS